MVPWNALVLQFDGDEDFIHSILTDMRDELDEGILYIQEGLKGDDFEAVASASHKMKGSAASMHLSVLEEAARELNVAAKQKQVDKRDLLSKMGVLTESKEKFVAELSRASSSKKGAKDT